MKRKPQTFIQSCYSRLVICHTGTRQLKRILSIGTMSLVLLGTTATHADAKRIHHEKTHFTPGMFPVNGTVKNEKNEPIVGATVKIKGSPNTVITDNSGSFVIDAVKGDVLVISSIGYREREITVGEQGAAALSVNLEYIERSEEEVVVIGFGQSKRRDLTGSIVSVKSKEITARPGPNPMESLQGRVAGLDITRTSGQAGAGVNIQLRGTRSFAAGGSPIFIINGLPGDYSTLNPNDIESIEVLKDASSTAVYGSAGSNGVIIITTKSAKAGKMQIDFNTYYGYNGNSIVPKMLHGNGYLEAKREAHKYVYDAAQRKWVTTGATWQSPADDSAIFGSTRWPVFKTGKFVDWADLFLQDNAGTQNYSIGISGGTEKTKAYISFNYTDEKGQYRGDQFKLFATTMRVDHQVKKWIAVGTNLQLSYIDRDRAQDKLENALVTDPLVQPYKADGSINPDLGNNTYNLLLDYQPGVYGNVDNDIKIYLNPYLEIKPIKGLSFLSRLGTQLTYSNSYRFDGIGSVNYTYVNAQIAKAAINQNRGYGYQWENILTYNFQVKRDHDFTVTAVSAWAHSQNTNTSMTQNNILSNNFKWYRFTGDANTLSSSSYSMRKTMGFVGRLSYSYKSKYLFSASVRRDGNSALYVDNQWDNFPGASAAWRISEENFMKGTANWLNSLKLRIGWGITGLSNIPAYSSVSIVESANMSLGGVTAPIFRSSQFITNPELGWEKSHNTNLGLEASLFKNRIDLTVDYYTTLTKGVIYSVTAPIINGTYRPGSPYNTNINIAETKNKGFEVMLNTRNIVSKNFDWTSNLAFTRNKEEILKLSGTANNVIPAGSTYTLMIGEAVNSYRNFKLDGIWQIGEELDAVAFGRRPGDIKVNVPGMVKLQDGVFVRTNTTTGAKTYYYTVLSEAQKYEPSLTAAQNLYTYSSATDYQFVGQNVPKWTLGFQNTFRYKNFDLTIFSYLRWGQTINYVMMGWYQPSGFAVTASPSRTFPAHFNYWTPTNPSNDFPAMNIQTGTNMLGYSGLQYVDGSFFKIKNISLGYNLPQGLLKKVSIQRLRLYATMTNPVILAKSDFLKNYDPEMNGSMDYPLTKQIVAGLNVTF